VPICGEYDVVELQSSWVVWVCVWTVEKTQRNDIEESGLDE